MTWSRKPISELNPVELLAADLYISDISTPNAHCTDKWYGIRVHKIADWNFYLYLLHAQAGNDDRR